MNKEDLIHDLRNAGLRAIATVSTEDMGFQYDFITPDGAGTGFGGMGAWPALSFGPIDQVRWEAILRELRTGQVTLETLQGTGLDLFVKDIFSLDDISYAEILQGLLSISDWDGVLYCLYDTGKYYETLPFFTTRKTELVKGFMREFCFPIKPWSEMTYEELEKWHDRLNKDLSELNIYHYPSEEP